MVEKRDRIQLDVTGKRREKLDALKNYFGVDSDIEMLIKLVEKVFHIVEDETIQVIRYQDSNNDDVLVLPKDWLLK